MYVHLITQLACHLTHFHSSPFLNITVVCQGKVRVQLRKQARVCPTAVLLKGGICRHPSELNGNDSKQRGPNYCLTRLIVVSEREREKKKFPLRSKSSRWQHHSRPIGLRWLHHAAVFKGIAEAAGATSGTRTELPAAVITAWSETRLAWCICGRTLLYCGWGKRSRFTPFVMCERRRRERACFYRAPFQLSTNVKTSSATVIPAQWADEVRPLSASWRRPC